MNDNDLPANVAQGLAEFVQSVKHALGPDLRSIALFGSAAENRLRATSDVNVVVVLTRFDPERIDALREPLRMAHTLIGLEAMLILESELAAAAEAFAVKFADIHARHRMLHGDDPFSKLEPSRGAMLMRLRQILLNFILRTRERYALVSLREEQLASVVADAAAPLRSAAALILALEGTPAATPKAALETLGGDRYRDALAHVTGARESQALPPGAGRSTVLALLALAEELRERTAKIG